MTPKGLKFKESIQNNISGDVIDLYLLPEDCIACVISFTGPCDACNLASVSKVFKSAADSNSVWECFLPSDYPDIIARSNGPDFLLGCVSKKELFLRLVNQPLLIDDATMSFFLEKTTGKKCYTIGAKALSIIWGDTPKYWTWHSVPSSRFHEVAELITVCWLEIQCKIKASMLSPDTNYGAYLIYKMSETAYGFHSPAELVVKTVGGKTKTRNAYLDDQEIRNQRYQIVPRRIGMINRIRTIMTRTQQEPTNHRDEEDGKKMPKQRKDGWMEVEIGEFFNQREEEGDVEISVLEVKGGNWKSGLLVEGIEIRPKIHPM